MNGHLQNLKIAQGLFYLNAVIWFVFGSYTLLGMAGRYPDQTITAYLIGFMMLGNVAAMALRGSLIGKRNKWYYYFAILVIVINIILTGTDQIGFFYFATLVADLVIFGILIFLRRQYLSIP